MKSHGAGAYMHPEYDSLTTECTSCVGGANLVATDVDRERDSSVSGPGRKTYSSSFHRDYGMVGTKEANIANFNE